MAMTLHQELLAVRRKHMVEALIKCDGHRRNAARMMGMARSHFYYWLDKLDLGGVEVMATARHRRFSDLNINPSNPSPLSKMGG